MTDFFKSVPQKGAIVRDFTKATLVVDVQNSLGEKFHFEIEPNEKDDLPVRVSDAPGGKNPRATVINMLFPLL